MPNTTSPRLLALAAALAAFGLAGSSLALAQADDQRSPVTDTYGRPTRTDVTRQCVRYDFRGTATLGDCVPKAEAAPTAAPAPEPAPAPVKQVVETPPPPPVPVATPTPPPPPPPVAKPAPRRITLDADALFSFQSSTLNRDGMHRLDELAAELGKVRYESVSVTGHTDRIGAKTYNERLSEKRAESVKAYLVDHGVDPGHIDARGVGSSEPVTGGKCDGIKQQQSLILCLAPDRRVDVQAVATAQ